jgi:hypothetical protein
MKNQIRHTQEASFTSGVAGEWRTVRHEREIESTRWIATMKIEECVKQSDAME